MKEKLDDALRQLIQEPILPDSVSVIIQTVDGLKEDDKNMLKTLGGALKDDLYIINSFSADLPGRALETLILSPRVTRVWLDAQVTGA